MCIRVEYIAPSYHPVQHSHLFLYWNNLQGGKFMSLYKVVTDLSLSHGGFSHNPLPHENDAIKSPCAIVVTSKANMCTGSQKRFGKMGFYI